MLRAMLVLFTATGALGFGTLAWVATHPPAPPPVVVPQL